MNDIPVFVNGFLQLKIDQALSDVTRFIFNSTIGLLGIFDISSEIGLPKHDEDFGQTLGYYGIDPGPFLMIPFIGPLVLRDAFGFGIDSLLSPVSYLDNKKVQYGLMALNFVRIKADLLSTKEFLGDVSVDEYEFLKNAYFEKRKSQVRDGAALDYSEAFEDDEYFELLE